MIFSSICKKTLFLFPIKHLKFMSIELRQLMILFLFDKFIYFSALEMSTETENNSLVLNLKLFCQILQV